MDFLFRAFIKFLVLLVTVIVGFILVFDEGNTTPVFFSRTLFENTACIRRNDTDRYAEGYHYPNQTLYRLIVTGKSEEWVALAPNVRENIQVMIVSLTRNNDQERRTQIRHTWARKENLFIQNGNVRVLFLLGNNEEDMECLLREQNAHQDLLVVKTRDSYRGLVYKLLMAMRFISHKYPQAHLVKIDEDVIVDINQLMVFLSEQPNSIFILGYPFFGAPVIREENHTFFVPVAVYPPDRYPWYENGNFYIISNNSLKRLMAATPLIPVFEIEDAFITGVLRTTANLTLDSLPNSGFYQPSYPLCTEEYYEKLTANRTKEIVMPSPPTEVAICLIYLRNTEKGQFEKAKVYWEEFWKMENRTVYLP